MTSPHLSLIIPIFNEKNRLAKGLRTVVKFLDKQEFSWEIIVVDDGSTDHATNAFPFRPNVFLLRTHTNFGKGHAIKLGIEAARGQYIFFTDIDLSVPLTFTSLFLSQLTKHDIVIGSRRLRTSKITQAQSSLRQSLGHGFTKLSNLVLGLNHTDHTCGFKAFRHKVAQKLFKKLRTNRWAFDSEILFLAHKYHYSVKEIPVTWKNDPHTKVRLMTDVINSFLALVRIRL
jgi:dolichyl-phosphate beta-glucosyltransferase